MRCPYCGSEDNYVTDSRSLTKKNSTRRRRKCSACGKRFSTHEIIDESPIIVIKKNGAKEMFDRNKILRGLLKACEKRPVTTEKLEKAIDEIEMTIRSNYDEEIESNEIGELILDKLKSIDEVAYVRFASVYKEFNSVDAFRAELKKF